MMWHDGWTWWWMALSMTMFWVVIGLVVWAIVRTAQRPTRSGAQDILDERYAKGELSKDEYQEQRRVLVGR